MSIQCSSCTKSDTSSDYQVQKLQGKIDDWQSCPTTDAKTKQEKVDKLRNEMDAVKADLQTRAEVRQAQAEATGTGRIVDVSI